MKHIRILVVAIALFLLAPWYFPSFQAYAADTGEGPYYLQTFNGYIESMKMADEGKLHKEGGDTTSVVNNMNVIVALSIGSTDKKSAFYYQNSTLAQIGKTMAYMYETPPASTYAFVQDMGQTLGFLPKKTYAADGKGSGYTGLLPILPIWKSFRNIAYGLLAIAMIIVGFMVMFRKKIDPKTVMTVQNSLPRIVVTLLLISFSYAIAGFLIDCMYVLILLSIEILKNSKMQYMDAVYLRNQYMDGGIWALLMGVMSPVIHFIQLPITTVANSFISGRFLDTIQTITGTLALTVTGIGPLFVLLIAVGYLIVFIRLLIMLFICYIQILMDVIFSPLQLLVDVFPGSNQTTAWFKHIISNLLAFPITIFMLILGDAISKSFDANLMWQPPLLQTGFTVGSVSTGQGQAAFLGQVLIWLGIISAIPTIITQVKEMLKTKGGLQMGGGGGAVAGIAGTAMNYGWQYWMGKRNADKQTRAMQEWMDPSKNKAATAGRG